MQSLSAATISSALKIALAKAKPVAMTAGILLSLCVPFEDSMAIAQTAPTRARTQQRISSPSRTVTPPARSTATPAIPAQVDSFAIQNQFVGDWRGGMVHDGDDVYIQYELQLSANGQGSWQLLGSNYNPNTDSYTTAIFEQGTLTYAIESNDITLQFSGGSQPMTLVGQVQNDPILMAGHVTGTDLVFRFGKSQ